jgi:hypothetical protein
MKTENLIMCCFSDQQKTWGCGFPHAEKMWGCGLSRRQKMCVCGFFTSLENVRVFVYL